MRLDKFWLTVTSAAERCDGRKSHSRLFDVSQTLHEQLEDVVLLTMVAVVDTHAFGVAQIRAAINRKCKFCDGPTYLSNARSATTAR
jgi:hypothetical protein